MKKVHVVLFQNLRFSKILKFEMMSNSDLYFIQCKIWGVGRFHHKAILCVQRTNKICACDLLRRSVFWFSAFCVLEVEIEKIFWACDKIFQFIILVTLWKIIFEKTSKHGQKKIYD